MIIRTPKERNYFAVSNTVAQDSRLSFEARGVIMYLLSKPSDWSIQLADLEREGNMGREKRQRIVAELEEFGYLVRHTVRIKGKFNTEYELRETPEPSAEKPRTGSPSPVKPPLQSTEEQITENTHTESACVRESAPEAQTESRTTEDRTATQNRTPNLNGTKPKATAIPVNDPTPSLTDLRFWSIVEARRLDSPFNHPDWEVAIEHVSRHLTPEEFESMLAWLQGQEWRKGPLSPKTVANNVGAFLETQKPRNGDGFRW